MKGVNKERLRAFVQRRRINALGLLVITFGCAVMTIICAVQGFERTDILGLVTILLVALCFIQEFKLRKGFRTIHSAKGLKRKKNKEAEKAHS